MGGDLRLPEIARHVENGTLFLAQCEIHGLSSDARIERMFNSELLQQFCKAATRRSPRFIVPQILEPGRKQQNGPRWIAPGAAGPINPSA